MVLQTKDLFDAVAILTNERNMRVTLKQSGKGALICGASCFVGGLFLGPAGMALGGTLGGAAAWKLTQGTFKPVSEIITNDLTPMQRDVLVTRIIAAVREFEVSDIAVLLPLLLTNGGIQTAVLNTVVSFIGKEMNLQIVD